MENKKITREDFERVIKYCLRNNIDSVLDFLHYNENELIAKNVKLKSFITPKILHSASCDDFIVTAYALKHNVAFSWYEEFVEEATSFDMEKLIINDIEVNEGLTGIKLYKLITENLNYKYIQSVLDKIAEENGYEVVTKEQLLEKHFSLSELSQVIVGLEEKDQQIIRYKPMCLKDFENIFSKYYIKTKK